MSDVARSGDNDLIARANEAWSAEDVQSSARGVAALYERPDQYAIMTPTITRNPQESLAVIGMHEGIIKFWTRYSRRFSVVWMGMMTGSRRNLLLTVAPEMARTRSPRGCEGQLILLPEFVVKELSTSCDDLIRIIEDVADTELKLQYFNDTQMVRTLVRDGKVHPDTSRTGYMALLHGGSHVGEIVQFNASRARGEDAIRKLNYLIEKGFAVEGPVWSLVIQRRSLLLTTLARTMDEMRVEVFQKHAGKNIMIRTLECNLPSCKKTSSIGADGSEKPLKICTRCGVAAYCSKECQVEDWRNGEHKKFCKKKKMSRAT